MDQTGTNPFVNCLIVSVMSKERSPNFSSAEIQVLLDEVEKTET